MKALISNIEQWADERNLIKGSTPDKQMLKLMEEFGELCGGIAKNKPDVIKDSIGDCMVVLIILANQYQIKGSNLFEIIGFNMPPQYNSEIISLDFILHLGELSHTISVCDEFNKRYREHIIRVAILKCFGSLLATCYDQKLDIKDCLQHAYDQIKNRKGKMIDGVFVKEEDLQGKEND